jgi:transcriptional regulator with AAA-type ATPase domain
MAERNDTVSVDRGAGSGVAPAAAQLVLLAECDQPLAPSSRHLLAGVNAVEIGRGPTRRVARTGASGGRLEIRLSDRALSAGHAKLLHLHGRWVLEDQGSKNGSLVNGTPLGRAVLGDGDLVELGGSFFLFRDAVGPVAGDDDAQGLDSFAPAVTAATVALGRVARSSLPVLIRGETGTGKELAARALHARSGRPGKFTAVNCGALAPNLVEAELFGHRRGAFSGALEDRPGLVRSADRGTLFLDEVGDLPAASQAALLRVLQEREVLPIGETTPVSVDVRVVAATHRELGAGTFRADLHARLAGLLVELPPLRARREDLGLLLAALLARAGAGAVRFTPAALRALFLHDWPQNVRELDMAVRAAVLLAAGAVIDAPHLPANVGAGAARARAPAAAPLSNEDENLRAHLVESLTRHQGNVAAVARDLGKGRMQIHRWLRRFGLDLSHYRR